MNPEKRSMLPHSAFSSFASRFREPQLKEGFDEIIRLDFKVSLMSSTIIGMMVASMVSYSR